MGARGATDDEGVGAKYAGVVSRGKSTGVGGRIAG